MCFSAPSISVPDTPTPAPLPPPIEQAPTVDSVKFGDVDTDTETASGVKGKRAKGKSSLQIKKRDPKQQARTGANYAE